MIEFRGELNLHRVRLERSQLLMIDLVPFEREKHSPGRPGGEVGKALRDLRALNE